MVCDETSEFFAIAARSKPPAATAGGIAAALAARRGPAPVDEAPPRKTTRSDALSLEMSAPEARPPTAPERELLRESY